MNKNVPLIKELSFFSIKIICLWVMLVLILSGALYSVSRINRGKIRDNTIESFDILRQEGDYYRFPFGGPMLQKDNFTDAIMIGSAYSKDPTKSEIDNTFSSPSLLVDTTLTYTESMYRTVSSGDTLKVEDVDFYTRYWHGYLTTLRPLLLFFSIKEIRIINYFVLYGLALISLWLIWRKLGKFCAFAFFSALLITAFPIVPDTLQFVTAYMLALLACVYTLSVPRGMLSISRFGLFLFIVGGLTSYFDFLTTPVLTFGFPCVFALMLRKNLPDWKFIIVCGFMWCLGYVSIWASKWILSGLLASVDIIEQTRDALITRTHFVITDDNIKGSHIVLIITIILFAVSFIWSILYGIRKGRLPLIKRFAGLAFIGCVPFIWVLAFQGHCFPHFWFVWRSFAVSVIALLIFYYKTFYLKASNEENSCSNTLLQ